MIEWRSCGEGYEVSNDGQVRSLDRINARGDRLKGRVLSLWFNGEGYRQVDLCIDGKRLTRKVHSLVAEAFIGPRPDGHEVAHGPGGQLDNSVGNLSYKTHRENSCEDKNRDNEYSSRHPGVYWDKQTRKWRSKIAISGVTKHLGRFDCELDAAQAYRNARERIGEPVLC